MLNNKIFSLVLSLLLIIGVYYNSFLPRYNAAKMDFIKENVYLNCINKLGVAGHQTCLKLREEEGEKIVKYYENFYSWEEGRYLIGIDPYYYYRLTKNLIEKGHYYETLKDYDKDLDGIKEKVPYDDKQYSPVGKVMGEKPPFIVELQYWFYKIVTFFKPELKDKIMGIIFWIPVIIAPISAIFAFLIGSFLFNRIIGLMFGLFMVYNTTFLSRSIAGFSDTDYLNITLPLIALYFFLLAFYSRRIINKIVFYLFSSIFLGLFAWAWTGWWYIYWVILTFLGLELLKEFIEFWRKEKKINIKNFVLEKRKKIMEYFGFFISSSVIISLISSFNTFISFLKSPFLILLGLERASSNYYWPNTLLTVAEMGDTNLKGIINSVFSFGPFNLSFLAWFGIIGAILFTINSIKNRRYELLALIFWLIASIIFSLKGVRFIMYLGVPLAFFAGYFIYYSIKYITDLLVKDKFYNQIIKITSSLIVLFIIILKGSFIYFAFHSIGEFNDNWLNTMNYIKENDFDVITSWWDFGHYFIAMSKKMVTFDGGSQTTPRAFWVGKALQSNESLAKGIITMLTTNGDKPFNFIITYLSSLEKGYSEKEAYEIAKIRIKYDEMDVKQFFKENYKDWEELYYGTFNGTAIGVKILLEILYLSKEEAIEKLKEGIFIKEINKTIILPQEVINDLINLTFPSKPNKVAFIVSQDMVGKAGAWGALGNWDFFNPPKTKEEFYTLAKFYLERDFKELEKDLYIVWMDLNRNNFVDSSDFIFKLNVSNETKPILKFFDQEISFMFFDKDKGEIIEEKNNEFGHDILIIKENNNYKIVLMSKGLLNSIFTKMWYLEGETLKYFKKVYTNPSNPKIIVYSLN